MGNPLSNSKGDADAAAKHQSNVARRILAAWQKRPNQRLGQFVYNAMFNAGMGADPFYVEDARLAEVCEAFVADVR